MKVKRRKIDTFIHWLPEYCKHCYTCIHICPVENLSFDMDQMASAHKCIQCQMCMKYCPDFAIEVKGKK